MVNSDALVPLVEAMTALPVPVPGVVRPLTVAPVRPARRADNKYAVGRSAAQDHRPLLTEVGRYFRIVRKPFCTKKPPEHWSKLPIPMVAQFAATGDVEVPPVKLVGRPRQDDLRSDPGRIGHGAGAG